MSGTQDARRHTPLCVKQVTTKGLLCSSGNSTQHSVTTQMGKEFEKEQMHVCVCAKSLQGCPPLCDPMEPDRLLCLWNFLGQNLGEGYHFLEVPRDLPDSGIKPASPNASCTGRQVLYHSLHTQMHVCVSPNPFLYP